MGDAVVLTHSFGHESTWTLMLQRFCTIPWKLNPLENNYLQRTVPSGHYRSKEVFRGWHFSHESFSHGKNKSVPQPSLYCKCFETHRAANPAVCVRLDQGQWPKRRMDKKNVIAHMLCQICVRASDHLMQSRTKTQLCCVFSTPGWTWPLNHLRCFLQANDRRRNESSPLGTSLDECFVKAWRGLGIDCMHSARWGLLKPRPPSYITIMERRRGPRCTDFSCQEKGLSIISSSDDNPCTPIPNQEMRIFNDRPQSTWTSVARRLIAFHVQLG